MPAEAESVRITDVYRAQTIEARRRIALAAGALWQIDPERLEESFGFWLSRMALLLAATQADLARLSDAYVATFVSSELGEAVAPVGVDVGAYAGKTIDGRAVADVLGPALFTVKRLVGDGKPFEQASAAGRARAVRNVEVETAGASRAALDEALEREPRVRGWRRVTSRRPCGACLAARTGAIQKTSELLRTHPHCSCSKEPVVEGVRERIKRPTGAELFESMSKTEQDALFAGRGGADKAELVRSGAVDLSDLASSDRQALDGRPAILTETPLAKLA